MIINAAFESFDDLFTLQEKIVDDDADTAQTARDISMCGARSTNFDLDSIRPNFTTLVSGILSSVFANPPSAIWDPHLPGFNEEGSSSFLFPSKSADGSLTFSILSMPEHSSDPTSYSIFGLLNDQAFTRTATFDEQGISSGAIRFTELNFANKSPPNRLRFTASSCPTSKRTSLRKSLETTTENAQGRAMKNHSNFYALSSGQKFHELCGATEGIWTRESSTLGKDFEFFLPAYLPLPHGHNLTIVKPVTANDSSPDFIQASLISAGVRPDSDTSWLYNNPVFQVWHAAMLSNSDHSTPTTISSVNFSSIQDKATYKACLSCFRRVSSDWLKEVESQSNVFDSLLADPSLSLEDFFPPEGITCSLNLPESNPAHLVLEQAHHLPVPAAAPYPVLAMPTGVVLGHQQMLPPGPAIPLRSLHQASSSDFNLHSSSSNASKRANTNSRRTWQLYGLIDHKNRSRIEGEDETSLTATIEDLSLWTPNHLSGTTSPLVPQIKSFYLASPLHGNFLSILDAKATKTSATDMASSFKSNFLNFLDNSGKRFSHNLQADKSRFFCGDIFLWIMNSTLYQRSLRKDTDLDRFSLLHICLLHEKVDEGLNHNPIFPEMGFESFEDVKAIVETIKWFLTNIFHRDHYQSTIIYKGLEFLIAECEKRHFNYVWKNTESFSKAIATYILIHSIHNLGSLAAAMASNVSEDAAYAAFLSIPSNPDPTPCFLSPPKLTDPSFATNMFDTTSTWLSTLATHLELCGSYDNHDCIKSCNNSEITTAIANHCLFSSKKRKPTSPGSAKEPIKDNDQSSKKQKRIKKEGSAIKDGKPTVADPGTNLLRPAKHLTIADVLEKAKNQSDKFHLPKVLKGTVTGFENNCRLCLNFLLGGTCLEQKCGYHLFRSKNMYGTHEEWQFMRTWIKEEKQTVLLSEEASSNSKWAPTYSE